MGRRCWLAIIVVMWAGCSAGDAPPVPVSGRVTFHGYPVSGGVIAFTPDRQRGGGAAAGRTRLAPDGSFRLGNGLPPGWYRLTVASLDVWLPPRYRDPDLAELFREIKAGSENRIELALGD